MCQVYLLNLSQGQAISVSPSIMGVGGRGVMYQRPVGKCHSLSASAWLVNKITKCLRKYNVLVHVGRAMYQISLSGQPILSKWHIRCRGGGGGEIGYCILFFHLHDPCPELSLRIVYSQIKNHDTSIQKKC